MQRAQRRAMDYDVIFQKGPFSLFSAHENFAIFSFFIQRKTPLSSWVICTVREKKACIVREKSINSLILKRIFKALQVLSTLNRTVIIKACLNYFYNNAGPMIAINTSRQSMMSYFLLLAFEVANCRLLTLSYKQEKILYAMLILLKKVYV